MRRNFGVKLFALLVFLLSPQLTKGIVYQPCPSPEKVQGILNQIRHDPASITAFDEPKAEINQATKIDDYVLLSIGKDYTNTNDQRKREMQETPISQMEYFVNEPMNATDFGITDMLHDKAKQLKRKNSICAYHGQLDKGRDIYIFIGKPNKPRLPM
jgi:hypothetical protein